MERRRANEVVHGFAGAAAGLTGVFVAMGCGAGACAACPGCLGMGSVAAGLLVVRSVVRAVRERQENAGVDRPACRDPS